MSTDTYCVCNMLNADDPKATNAKGVGIGCSAGDRRVRVIVATHGQLCDAQTEAVGSWEPVAAMPCSAVLPPHYSNSTICYLLTVQRQHQLLSVRERFRELSRSQGSVDSFVVQWLVN